MSGTPEVWTVGRLLAWTSDYLARHGSPTPRLDAELLLAHVRQCPRIGLYTHFGEEVATEQREAFKELIRRRARGEPVAYLTGHKEFYSLSFEVTPDVLVPRPETEGVLEAVLDRARPMLQHQPQLALADVGTGSGILAVCAARFLPNVHVTAIDVSAEAIAVAQRNAQRHQVADRIDFRVGDLLQCLPPETRFDIVMSNPPYVAEHEFETLPPDVRCFEPRRALVAGPTGMEIIQRLVEQSPCYLRPGGWLVMEISPMLDDSVRRLFCENAGWRHFEVLPDLAGHARVVAAQYLPAASAAASDSDPVMPETSENDRPESKVAEAEDSDRAET